MCGLLQRERIFAPNPAGAGDEEFLKYTHARAWSNPKPADHLQVFLYAAFGVTHVSAAIQFIPCFLCGIKLSHSPVSPPRPPTPSSPFPPSLPPLSLPPLPSPSLPSPSLPLPLPRLPSFAHSRTECMKWFRARTCSMGHLRHPAPAESQREQANPTITLLPTRFAWMASGAGPDWAHTSAITRNKR
jgi:hypothetical protein